ncbi:TauD/TfdA dioxygenase family protein [Marinobacter sp. F3R08]|uniref:TauD/TfdA dioxygenase family protein n=1 Tax=Marinobacter sp. F3R08 TaxID=2841559 RepID=UPI001C096136|nr:TauD/TfdA family dioxygenase [Marinobacter sp. F3R08]MBU2954264.1 TauD/TfdA family dioxygenase [Marinobacter sp. F3R08]
MAQTQEPTLTVAPLNPENLALLEQEGLSVKPLEPIGAEIYGADVRNRLSDPAIKALEAEMANRGFIVFKHQAGLSSEELIDTCTWWGGHEIHLTHGVHPATPGRNRRIFRSSSAGHKSISRTGTQWHNDGNLEAASFSHSAYYIARAPHNGAGTHFAHQGAAFDALPPDKQDLWQRLVSVNSASSVTHPVVHTHPISGRKSVWLHLGMTGAVIERLPDEGLTIDQLKTLPAHIDCFRLLDEVAMKNLFNDYNDLLDHSIKSGYGIHYEFDTGDLLFIDNWAVAHRASPNAHEPATQQGLDFMDRVIIKAPRNLSPQFGLPQYINMASPHPFNRDGVWQAGEPGFRWKDDMRTQN